MDNKQIGSLFFVLLSLTLLTGCGGGKKSDSSKKSEKVKAQGLEAFNKMPEIADWPEELDQIVEEEERLSTPIPQDVFGKQADADGQQPFDIMAQPESLNFEQELPAVEPEIERHSTPMPELEEINFIEESSDQNQEEEEMYNRMFRMKELSDL
ncbi:hypothetical protein HOL34_00470 [bacterium]|jgi:hypothetical protein|nr:hypothetical protein [bacterium]MBT4577833.1 hypothetical protein [bacterium]MBT5345465.1 hypothetical protein [bacterium]MBT6131159.1 hypothetical protein [bacterium]MBT6528567.1 hypothetical protein [bacterium]